jgi:hypothetical protein
VKDWKYYIIDVDNGEYLYLSAGAVASSVSPKELIQGPDGWQDISAVYERSFDRLGVVRSMTVPLSFIRDGAEILRHEFYTKSIERRLYLKIERRVTEVTSGYYRHNYQFFYRGEINFTSFKDDGVRVTVNLSEGGISKKITAAENTVQELPMDSGTINVLLDGINIDYSAQMSTFHDLYVSLFQIETHWLLNFSNTSVEQHRVYVALSDITVKKQINVVYNYSTSEDWFLTVTDAVTINFHFRLKGILARSVTLGGTGVVRIKLINQAGTIIATFLDHTLPSGSPPFNFNIDTTVTIAMNTGDKLFLVAEIFSSTPSSLTISMVTQDSDTTITYKAKYRQSIVKAKLPSVVYKSLIGAATGNQADADDTYVQTFDHLALSPGDSIRGIQTNVKLKTKLSDFLQFARVQARGELGIINGLAVIKRDEDFLDNSTPIPIKIKNLVISDATDLRINTIKVGYPKQDIEGVGGKLEFNNTFIFDTPQKTVVKELDLVCPYLAQPYLIEDRRVNLDGKVSTDDNTDNEIFILDVDLSSPTTIDGQTVYPLRRVVYDVVEGIPDPVGVFNLEISPKRLLLLHMERINSLMHGMDGQNIIFKSTELNPTLKTTLGSVVIDEDADETIGTDKMFLPYYLDSDVKEPVNLVETLEPDPNVCFSFGQGGEGFLMKIGDQPDEKKEQSYKLLATPDVDIINLQKNAYK